MDTKFVHFCFRVPVSLGWTTSVLKKQLQNMNETLIWENWAGVFEDCGRIQSCPIYVNVNMQCLFCSVQLSFFICVASLRSPREDTTRIFMIVTKQQHFEMWRHYCGVLHHCFVITLVYKENTENYCRIMQKYSLEEKGLYFGINTLFPTQTFVIHRWRN